MIYISALMIGLLGSFHCIGMCGPIAIALPLKNDNWFTRIFGGLLYNTGRTITYAILGAIFGLAGMGLRLGGLQQWVSIIMGIIMILSVIFPLIFRRFNQFNSLSNKLTSKLISRFKKMFGIRTYYSLFIIGILNGFLPCGLVYIAVAGALAVGEVYESSIYMIFFGLGTIPVMLILSLIGNVVSVKFRNIVRRILPFLVIIIGILFILRGMNLGIKYVSPKMNKEDPVKIECCH